MKAKRCLNADKGILILFSEVCNSFLSRQTEQLTLSEVRFDVTTFREDPPYRVTFQAILPDIVIRNFFLKLRKKSQLPLF